MTKVCNYVMLKKSDDKMINIPPSQKKLWKNISQITEQFHMKEKEDCISSNVGLESRKIKFQNSKKLQQLVLKEEKSKKQPNKEHNII